MKNVKIIGLGVLLVLCVMALGGCKKKADETRPIADVQAGAEKMDAAKLKNMAAAYKDAITAKQDEVKKLAENLKELGIAKMMSDEAKGIKADMSELGKSASALKDRFKIYYNKLKEKGGDLTGLEI